MNPDRLLFASGILLLAVAALLGFVQNWHRNDAENFARWRVVHAGGTAGALQLLVLAALWGRFAQRPAVAALAIGLVAATFAFFLGPLARALDRPRLGGGILIAGAAIALPTYVFLPLALFM